MEIAYESYDPWEEIETIPRPSVVPNYTGGIEFTWSNGQKHLQLIIDKNSRLFFKDGAKYGIEPLEKLEERLLWLVK